MEQAGGHHPYNMVRRYKKLIMKKRRRLRILEMMIYIVVKT